MLSHFVIFLFLASTISVVFINVLRFVNYYRTVYKSLLSSGASIPYFSTLGANSRVLSPFPYLPFPFSFPFPLFFGGVSPKGLGALKAPLTVEWDLRSRGIAGNLIWVGINCTISNLSWVKETKQPHKKFKVD